MIVSETTEPWQGLPASVADVIDPELPALSQEIIDSIAREVPEYARPLEGSFGVGVRTGVGEALRQFVELVRDPAAGRAQGREVYVALGRGELRQGRTLDSLQAAYRVGARVAWRRLSAAARRAELDRETTSLLAEAIFAYINQLSAESVEGYAQAQSERAGERQRRRRELVALLLMDPPAPEAELAGAAQAAGWTVPRSAAALACVPEELDRISRRLPPDALAAAAQGVGCVVLADPVGPGRRRELVTAIGEATAALGPAGQLGELRDSWELATVALRATKSGAIERRGLVIAEEHLAELLLIDNPRLLSRLADRRLAALRSLTPKAQDRLAKTALAYVQERGNAVAMARSLRVHPQTARYRVAQLRELLGEQLDQVDGRFELELALRARGVSLP
jgi:PucR C-terminal helix-turn-helix domain